MGIDVYTFYRTTGPDGDVLNNCEDLDIDWTTVLGHPINIGWSDKVWTYGSDEKPDNVGYIRESYHGHAHPIRILAPESFDFDLYEKIGKPDEDGYHNHSGIYIPLETLKQRLPKTLEVARLRYSQYDGDPTQAESWRGYQQYIDFVKVHEIISAGDLQPYVLNSY